MKKEGFAIIVFGLVIMVTAVHFLSETLSSGLCPNTISTEVLSPNKQLKAVVFSQDCSNTREPGNVSILKVADPLPNNKQGNVLVQTGTTTGVRWLDDHTLAISYDTNFPIRFKTESLWLFGAPIPEQVTIKFEKK